MLPTASGDPVRSSSRLRALSAGDRVRKIWRLQAALQGVREQIEMRQGDDDGAPPLEPLQT